MKFKAFSWIQWVILPQIIHILLWMKLRIENEML